MGKSNTKKLTFKQEKFCEEYMKDGNGTRAAIRAGYSPNGASVTGSDLLANPNISEKIESLKSTQSGKTRATIENFLEQLSKLAFADRTKIFSADGSLLPVDEWPEECKACIVGVEVEELPFGVGSVKKVKMIDPGKALEMFGKYLGAFDKDNQQKKPITNVNVGYTEEETGRDVDASAG